MKTGAVFFGGGAFIALHAGYSKGPLSGIKFDKVYGVSSGALWASVYAFLGVEQGIQILGTIHQTSDIFAGKDAISFVGDNIGRAFPGIDYSYGPLQKLIQKYITGKPSLPVTISRVSIRPGFHQHVTAYPDGTFSTDNDSLGTVKTIQDFQNVVLSSCLVYPLVDAWIDPVTKTAWIDGGFREAGPVMTALRDGMESLHICLTGLFSEDPGLTGTGATVIDGIKCELLIMANQNMINDVDLALENINVESFFYKVQGQGTSDNFNQTDIQANILKGSQVTAVKGSDLGTL
jgi:hypothetical protein